MSQITCPACHKDLAVPANFAEEWMRCPLCQAEFSSGREPARVPPRLDQPSRAFWWVAGGMAAFLVGVAILLGFLFFVTWDDPGWAVAPPPVAMAFPANPIGAAKVDAKKPLQQYRDSNDKALWFKMLALTLADEARYDELRDLTDEHEKTQPDYALLYVRALLHNQDGEFEKADRLFAEADGFGFLDFNVDAFRRARVQSRFETGKALEALKVDPAPDTFEQLANFCVDREDFDLLEKLIAAQVSRGGNDAPHRQRFQVLLLLERGQDEEARKEFREILGREPDNAFEIYESRRVTAAMMYRDRLRQAYNLYDDPREGFRSLLAVIRDGNEDRTPARLKELVELHEKNHTDDPVLHLVRAEVLMHSRKFDEAAKLFRQWDKAPAQERDDWRRNYVKLRCEANRGIEVYRELAPDTKVFHDVGDSLIRKRNWKHLNTLLEEHRPNAGEDPEFHYFSALAAAHSQKFDEARAALDKAIVCAARVPEALTPEFYEGFFAERCASLGRGIWAVQNAKNQRIAFEAVGNHFSKREDHKQLEELLQACEPFGAGDANFRFFRGEAHRLRFDHVGALPHYEKAAQLAKSKDPRFGEGWAHCRRLLETKLRLRQIKSAFDFCESKSPRSGLSELGDLCRTERLTVELAEVLELHRAKFGKDSVFAYWELELPYVRGDYAATLKVLADRGVSPGRPGHQPRRFELEIRSLAHLKRFDEATKALEKARKMRLDRVNRTAVFVEAKKGDADAAIAVVERWPSRHLVEDCYGDKELRPILRGPAMAKFRERYPEPAEDDF